MGIFETIIATVIAGLIVAAVTFFAKQMFATKTQHRTGGDTQMTSISSKQEAEIIANLRKCAHEFSDQHSNREFAGRDLVSNATISALLDTLKKKHMAAGLSPNDASRESAGEYGILLRNALLQQPGKTEFERLDKPESQGPARYRRLS